MVFAIFVPYLIKALKKQKSLIHDDVFSFKYEFIVSEKQ